VDAVVRSRAPGGDPSGSRALPTGSLHSPGPPSHFVARTRATLTPRPGVRGPGAPVLGSAAGSGRARTFGQAGAHFGVACVARTPRGKVSGEARRAPRPRLRRRRAPSRMLVTSPTAARGSPGRSGPVRRRRGQSSTYVLFREVGTVQRRLPRFRPDPTERTRPAVDPARAPRVSAPRGRPGSPPLRARVSRGSPRAGPEDDSSDGGRPAYLGPRQDVPSDGRPGWSGSTCDRGVVAPSPAARRSEGCVPLGQVAVVIDPRHRPRSRSRRPSPDCSRLAPGGCQLLGRTPSGAATSPPRRSQRSPRRRRASPTKAGVPGTRRARPRSHRPALQRIARPGTTTTPGQSPGVEDVKAGRAGRRQTGAIPSRPASPFGMLTPPCSGPSPLSDVFQLELYNAIATRPACRAWRRSHLREKEACHGAG
jgi:hypothetical protein